jgi:hypothetical protein
LPTPWKCTNAPPVETRIGLMILAFVLATLTRRLVELPAQRVFSTQRMARRKHGIAWVIAPSILLLAILGGGGFAIERTGGIPSHHRKADILPTDDHKSQFNRTVDHMPAGTNQLAFWYA